MDRDPNMQGRRSASRATKLRRRKARVNFIIMAAIAALVVLLILVTPKDPLRRATYSAATESGLVETQGEEVIGAYDGLVISEVMASNTAAVTDENGNSRPEWEVRFFEDAIEYGYVENDKFVLDHSDKICSIEQFSEHGFTVQAETDTGVQYTYKTSEDDETILEYYGTWDETKYADNYSGSASLFR